MGRDLIIKVFYKVSKVKIFIKLIIGMKIVGVYFFFLLRKKYILFKREGGWDYGDIIF